MVHSFHVYPARPFFSSIVCVCDNHDDNNNDGNDEDNEMMMAMMILGCRLCLSSKAFAATSAEGKVQRQSRLEEGQLLHFPSMHPPINSL